MRSRIGLGWLLGGAFVAGTIVGCMAGVPAPVAAPTSPAPASALKPPLVLDRADFRIGVTVQFSRIPSANELYDLQQVTGLAHVVLTLDSWPSYAGLEPLRHTPPESDLMVVLPGYPPSREAAEAWNLLEVRQRIILVVEGPPTSSGWIADLNAMRGLERVIVDTELPSRAGFERLQRPLSFRMVRD